MRSSLAFFLLWCACCLGCMRPPAAQPASPLMPDTLASAAPADTFVTLQRTPCFGTCPSYTVTVHADGSVVYVGGRFVAVEDTARAQLTPEALEQLADAFRAADYFALDDAYVAGNACAQLLTDHPTVITSIHLEDRYKRIEHYHGCRGFRGEKRLTALEDTIDAIVGTDRWIKGAE